MRKLIHSLVLTALTFFAASCQQENLEPVASGNSVTYTIQIPDVLMTKTSVPEKVDSLIYQVYRKADIDDLTKRPIYTGIADINDAGKAELVMEFVRQQEFIVLFWAQNSTAEVYDIADLRKVSIVKEKLSANDFSAEAFSGFDTVKDCVSASNGDVELTRPISQINIITTEDGLTLGQSTQIKLEQSEMIVDGLYDIYNVYSGQVASQGIFAPRYTFTKADVPTKDFKSGYKYVAMSYVGFAGNASANINVKLDIYTSEGKIHHNVNNIPVKANYRTNILGNLITGNAGYAVTIDKEWASPDAEVVAVAVSTADDLQDAINEIPAGVEGNIQLEGDIDLGMISTKSSTPSYGLMIPPGKTLILDLNGCTLSQEVGCTASYSMIENRGHLTIIDSKSEGKISFNDSGAGDPQFGWGSYTISNQGTLVVNSGTIEHTGKQNTQDNVAHMYCAIQQNNDKAILTVNGGTVSNQTYRSIRINSGKADIKGGNMIGQVWVHPFADNINLNIEGGNFQPTGADGSSVFVTNNEKSITFSVTGGFFATKISCSVPANLAGTVTGGTFTTSAKENTPADLYAGYHFVQEDEYYILEPCPVKVGETAYGTLNEAVNAVKEGETITILAGKTLSEGAIKLPAILKNVTFSGEEGATLKDMTIMAADGNSYSYDGLTFNAITFDNSRISLTG